MLCKQDQRESRPKVFQDRGLFLLPVKNGHYKIIKGEGYLDLPPITTKPEKYNSRLDFSLDTSKIGDSEMQHIDYAYANSLIKSFINDDSLILTIRGRKYTQEPFFFNVNRHRIEVESVQTEVDAGYEGKDQLVSVEAKNSKVDNIIIRQLYYPFRQWQASTKKTVLLLFFNKESQSGRYCLQQFQFEDIEDYNSIKLIKAKSFILQEFQSLT